MSALKKQVSELMVNQKHMLEAIKYLDERMKDIIEKAKFKENQVETAIESQSMNEIIVKNSDDIRVLKTAKEHNALAIKHIEEKIDNIDKEFKRTKNIVEEKASSNRKKLESVQKDVKSVKCSLCGEIYNRMIDLEKHIKNCHEEHQAYQCDHCDKRFALKWRLGKHMRLHTMKNVKPCHYFSNNKKCPFYEFGCKFVHADSNNSEFSHTEEEEEENESNEIKNDDLDSESITEYTGSSLFRTSTPKKQRIQCSECSNRSQCTDCFVRQTLKIGHRVHFAEDL